MCHASLQNDWGIVGFAWRFSFNVCVASFAVCDDICGSFQRTHLGDAGNDFIVPFYYELEFLVRINSAWVNVNCGILFQPLFSFTS